MKQFLEIATIVVSVVIVLLILVQGRGAGLGNAWGGSGERFQSRRGIEKWVMRTTVLTIAIFFVITLVLLAI